MWRGLPRLILMFTSSPADVTALVWGYKKGRELIRRMGVYRGPFAPLHPQFPGDSPAAAALVESVPVALDAPKIGYSKEDDEAIATNIRNFGEFWTLAQESQFDPQNHAFSCNNLAFRTSHHYFSHRNTEQHVVARYLSYEAKRARWSRRQGPQRLRRHGIEDCRSVVIYFTLKLIQCLHFL